jgi:glycosyltransferase involved in cell wall biosynthesis
LRTASGLGESARLCHDALKATGYEVFGVDLTSDLMQAFDYPEFAFADGRDVAGPATLLLHVNSPLAPLAMLRLGRRFVRDKYVVGYWAWELPRVPDDWRHGVAFVHEIWAPSKFTADAVLPVAQDRAVRVVPHPVALRSFDNVIDATRRRNHPFTVLTIFNPASSLARKNPIAAINAFQLAFGGDHTARLVVKTSNASEFAAGHAPLAAAASAAKNIVVIDKVLNAGEIDRLYQDADVVMSLHRSEGFGLTLAEAMMRGLPVVATGWSGNIDFVNAETGMPVPFGLIPAVDPQGTYDNPEMNWADPDIGAAADALLQLRREPDFAQAIGRRAAAYAAEAWSAQRYGETVRQNLSL